MLLKSKIHPGKKGVKWCWLMLYLAQRVWHFCGQASSTSLTSFLTYCLKKNSDRKTYSIPKPECIWYGSFSQVKSTLHIYSLRHLIFFPHFPWLLSHLPKGSACLRIYQLCFHFSLTNSISLMASTLTKMPLQTLLLWPLLIVSHSSQFHIPIVY